MHAIPNICNALPGAGMLMKANYKKWFLWSSLGSFAVGAAVTLARGTRRMESRPLSCRKLPRECHEIVLWTERFEVQEHGARFFVHDRYGLQPTSFKVWSILDLPSVGLSGSSQPEGSPIYHVTRTRIADEADGNSVKLEPPLQERFYGVVSVLDPSGRFCAGSAIARGGILEIRKCYVGGSSNGVESGEIHRSAAPILNYRIEYGPA
jgi:hypothetical protein